MPAPSPEAAPPIDLVQAAALCGDEGVRREVTAVLLRELPSERAALRAAATGSDGAVVARIAHRMKSSLAAVGAVPASAAAAALDLEARGQGPAVSELARRLDAELERAAIALAGSLAAGPAE